MLNIFFLIIVLMTSGGASDIFSFEEQPSTDKITDLLSLETLGTEPDRYELSKIQKGDFLPDEGDEFIIIKEIAGFVKPDEKLFWIYTAKFNENCIEIQDGGSQCGGTPVNILAGRIDATSAHSNAVLHWRETSGVEYIYAFDSKGVADVEIFKGRIITSGRKEEIALADMNGDGIDEIVAISLRSKKASPTDIDKVVVNFISKSDPGSESYAIIPAPVLDVDVMDIDSDGKDEIITLRETKEGTAKQSIWAIKRNDDGTYSEIPIVASSNLELVPSPPDSHALYYLTAISASGHFYHWINAINQKEQDFVKQNTCRLLPEGLVMGMAWGHFESLDDISLAIIVDETLAKRRWLAIYTPILNKKFINRINLFTSDEFRPKGDSPTAFDTDRDGFDELIYINETGKAMVLDLQTQKHAPLRIKNPNE